MARFSTCVPVIVAGLFAAIAGCRSNPEPAVQPTKVELNSEPRYREAAARTVRTQLYDFLLEGPPRKRAKVFFYELGTKTGIEVLIFHAHVPSLGELTYPSRFEAELLLKNGSTVRSLFKLSPGKNQVEVYRAEFPSKVRDIAEVIFTCDRTTHKFVFGESGPIGN